MSEQALPADEKAAKESADVIALKSESARQAVPVANPAARDVTAPKKDSVSKKISQLSKKSVKAATGQIDFFDISQKKARPRHRIIAASFILGVLIPSLFVSIYLIFIASDQFASRVAFSVRSGESQGAAMNLMGFLGTADTSSTTTDSYILFDFISSQAIVEEVASRVDLVSIYNRQGADWFFRLGQEQPIEDIVDYWQSMVHVEYDATSGLISVEVRAFDPEDANLIASEIIRSSENLVNELSIRARDDAVRFAKEEVAKAEMRLKLVRREMRKFRNVQQDVDPIANVQSRMTVLTSLEGELASTRAQLNSQEGRMSDSSPLVVYLKRKAAGLERQITEERARMGSGSALVATSPDAGGDISGAPDPFSAPLLSNVVAEYEELLVDREFAEKTYVSTLVTLETARAEAARKQRYLATFIRPTTSEEAEYPRRYIYSTAFAIGFLIIWATGVLVFYNIRDRS